MEHAPKPFGLAWILQIPQVPVETATRHRISAGTKLVLLARSYPDLERQQGVDFIPSQNHWGMSAICALRKSAASASDGSSRPLAEARLDRFNVAYRRKADIA
jgi:hypothetical protein